MELEGMSEFVQSFQPKIEACQNSLSSLYSKIILAYSDYSHSGRENRFFELFCSCLKELISQAYNSNRKVSEKISSYCRASMQQPLSHQLALQSMADSIFVEKIRMN